MHLCRDGLIVFGSSGHNDSCISLEPDALVADTTCFRYRSSPTQGAKLRLKAAGWLKRDPGLSRYMVKEQLVGELKTYGILSEILCHLSHT